MVYVLLQSWYFAFGWEVAVKENVDDVSKKTYGEERDGRGSVAPNLMHFVEKIGENLNLQLGICDNLIIMVKVSYPIRFCWPAIALSLFENLQPPR